LIVRIADEKGPHRGRVNAAALRLYMDRFDFQALSLDAAFRCVLTVIRDRRTS